MVLRRYVAAILGVTVIMTGQGITKTAKGSDAVQKNKAEHKFTNRLANQSSPYLLQHAHNPVDWYPWGPEALDKARKENKPIFLSIGYSTCHWCHVMERESFEDERIAKIMNEHFVNIKVDREQRPDVDAVYMNAVQMMTGSGGWPLSVFLTPEGKPFYGGTYFPPKDYYGRPSFEKVLLALAEAWKEKHTDIIESAGKISGSLTQLSIEGGKTDLTEKTLTNAFEYYRSTYDPLDGGFGRAPKFPQAANLSMLLGYWYRSGEKDALSMIEKTLDAMANGGMYDQLGGGFHRYSTDAKWLVPHFEKMLYDQALLSRVYVEAYQITGNQRYAKVAREIFDYILRDMTDKKSGFYSAEDADSEGQEGTFYVWEPSEIDSILGSEKAKIFNTYYGVTKKGNFEHDKSILNVTREVADLAKEFKKDTTEIKKILNESREKLLEHRSKRIRPHLDDKIIAGWNGLMISSMAYAGAVLSEPKYVTAAQSAARFVMGTINKDGRLKRYYRDGKVVGWAFLDDYAYLTAGLLDLYEASFDAMWLSQAKALADQMIDLFGDPNGGGFYLSGKDAERLIVRNKPSYDGAVPSGNSVAALALLKLGHLTMDLKYSQRAEQIIEAYSGQMSRSPGSLTTMLSAFNLSLGPAQEIVIAGDTDAADTKQMIKLVR
ncbi:MAG: thioredoxin domain-containing protein, partial [Planctomycetota bacterium]